MFSVISSSMEKLVFRYVFINTIEKIRAIDDMDERIVMITEVFTISIPFFDLLGSKYLSMNIPRERRDNTVVADKNVVVMRTIFGKVISPNIVCVISNVARKVAE